MSWDAVRQASIVLEVIGIALLFALLITPAPKHAIVNALTVAAILRSVCAVIPSIVYQRFRDDFDHIVLHPNWSDFCVGFAIILRYLTVVKAAFTVSFTSPLLYLAMQHSKYAGLTSSSNSAFYRKIIGFLCVGPFVWALPAVLVTLPSVIHDRSSLKPMFYEAACTISNTPYQIVSLTLMIVALLIATIISVAFVYIMWRHVRLPLLSRSLGVLDLSRILRFGALLGIIILSAVLYTVVMATWARDHVSRFSPRPMTTVFTLSIIWEAVTPVLMFFIFGAQEEVFEVWLAWYRCLRRAISLRDTPILGTTKPHPEESYLDFAHPPRQGRWHIFRRSTGPIKSEMTVDVKQESFSDESMDYSCAPSIPHTGRSPTISQTHHAVTREQVKKPMANLAASPASRHPSNYRISAHIRNPSALNDVSGLRPPPRPARSRSESPIDGYSVRHPFAHNDMPSLTAFGDGDSWDGRPWFTRTRQVIDRDVESTGDERETQLPVPSQSQYDIVDRPNTGQTSGTFGHYC